MKLGSFGIWLIAERCDLSTGGWEGPRTGFLWIRPKNEERPPTTPAARSPHRACKPRGQCWAPTPAHPRPQHVGDGPRQPAWRAGSQERGSAWPQTPLTTVKASPPGTPFRHPHSVQRRPARAHAVGPVPGPHTRTDRTRGIRVAEPRLPAPEGGRPGEGQRLTPDATHNGGRPPPRGRPPTTPAARSPHRACKPKGQLLGPHTRTPTPTARGWWTPTARPEDGQPGETGAGADSPRPHRPHPGHTGRRTPAARPRGRAIRGRDST